MIESQVDKLADAALEAGNFEAFGLLLKDCSALFRKDMLIRLAEEEEWERLINYVQYADAATLESLMEAAVEQGNFDAIDMLDTLL